MGSTFSVQDICKRYSVGEHTVLNWVASGELRALNIARSRRARRPRWRIREEDLAAFEAARTSAPATPRARRQKRQPDVIQFY
jgi:excisionase family DNA binding protein